MIQRQNSIIAQFLLFCFAFALVPFEGFHHHDWESEVCNENEIHFANHAVDCDLAEFFISKQISSEQTQLEQHDHLLAEYLLPSHQVTQISETSILRLRGPPQLA